MRPVLVFASLFAAVVAVVAAFGGADGRTLQAEFSNARGLVVGNDVRVNGAPAGRVEEIELTDRDTALVTMQLRDDAPAPKSDAVAAIRPVDLLGDIYVALSPGRASSAQVGPIPAVRTSNAPRLAQVLGAFREPARVGLQALIVELGTGLDRRGVDLGRAAVQLRPALAASDRLLAELDSQTADLEGLVDSAGSASRQLAEQDRALAGSVNGMAGTLKPIAAAGPQLDRTLARAPGLLRRLRGTSSRLSVTARRARPLAAELDHAAPALTELLDSLGGFLTDARSAIGGTRPTVRSLRGLLMSGSVTLDRLATGLTRVASAAPATKSLTAAIVPAAGDISDGFLRNFPDQAREPGTQPFDPLASPDRHYWKGAAVMSCQSFGLAISPGCLDRFLQRSAARKRTRGGAKRQRPSPLNKVFEGPLARPPSAATPSLPGAVKEIVDAIIPRLTEPPPSSSDLLDFLLKP